MTLLKRVGENWPLAQFLGPGGISIAGVASARISCMTYLWPGQVPVDGSTIADDVSRRTGECVLQERS
jgi:hypothetical protein